MKSDKPQPPETDIRFARIGNLILASLFFLGMIWPKDWMVVSLPPTSAAVAPNPLYGTTIACLICLWFLSAMFLFFRSRLAWFGSLVGSGLAFGMFALILIDVLRSVFYPNAEEAAHMSRIHSGEYMMIVVILWLLVPLVASLAIFIGLFKSRKELNRI